MKKYEKIDGLAGEIALLNDKIDALEKELAMYKSLREALNFITDPVNIF